MSITRIRVQRRDLPLHPCICTVPGPCVYRDKDRYCDEPRINKSNGDASCNRMSNRDLLARLSTPKG